MSWACWEDAEVLVEGWDGEVAEHSFNVVLKGFFVI